MPLDFFVGPGKKIMELGGRLSVLVGDVPEISSQIKFTYVITPVYAHEETKNAWA